MCSLSLIPIFGVVYKVSGKERFKHGLIWDGVQSITDMIFYSIKHKRKIPNSGGASIEGESIYKTESLESAMAMFRQDYPFKHTVVLTTERIEPKQSS